MPASVVPPALRLSEAAEAACWLASSRLFASCSSRLWPVYTKAGPRQVLSSTVVFQPPYNGARPVQDSR